jgi:hypothetical protein
MQRTNIYLDSEQLDLLKRVAEARGEPVAALIREAIDAWLENQAVRPIGPDEWERRFDALIRRRRDLADKSRLDEQTVTEDVIGAVREVRRSHAARRR